jgi:hypothetical protein
MEVTLPPNVSLVKLIGSPPGHVFISGPGAADGQRVVLLNATSTNQEVVAFDAANVIEPNETREFTYVAGEGWQPLSAGLAGNNDFWVQDGANDAIRNTNANGFYSTNPATVNSDPGILPLPLNGAGTRLMWIPEKSAFRLGTVDGGSWNADSIGTWSLAMGRNSKASAPGATAIGWECKATNEHSMALGYNTKSFGEYSFAAGAYCLAGGGLAATAFGYGCTSTGLSSHAAGHSCDATGWYSIAIGDNSAAIASRSVAIGSNCTAKGDNSVSIGNYTNAKSYAELTLGRYNDTIPGSSQTTWVPTDPLLTLGNGTSAANLSNAVTILKNGNMGIGNSSNAKVPNARLVVDGYTRLGTTPENAPAIKMKKLTGTGPVTDGTKAIVHGLNAAKILSVSVLMEYGLGPAETIPPKYTTSAGHEYEYQVRANDIFLLNKAGNSANIHQRPIRILITYEE